VSDLIPDRALAALTKCLRILPAIRPLAPARSPVFLAVSRIASRRGFTFRRTDLGLGFREVVTANLKSHRVLYKINEMYNKSKRLQRLNFRDLWRRDQMIRGLQMMLAKRPVDRRGVWTPIGTRKRLRIQRLEGSRLGAYSHSIKVNVRFCRQECPQLHEVPSSVAAEPSQCSRLPPAQIIQ
jgi:hypothetical protein